MKNASTPQEHPPQSRPILLICALALILSLLLACGGEGATEPGGPGQGAQQPEATAEAREEGTPTATRAASRGTATSAPQSGSALTPGATAGGRAEEGTPTATGTASAGAAAATTQPGSAPTPGAAARSASPAGPAPTETPAPSEGPTLEEYAAQHAGGPGAIYVGDISQLVGPPPSLAGNEVRRFFSLQPPTPTPQPAAPRPTPTPFGRAPAQSTPTPSPTPTPFPADGVLLDPDGNVTLKALEQHRWIYESPFYAELLKKARLTNPTPLTSSGAKITIEHACTQDAVEQDFSHELRDRVGLIPCLLLRDYFAPNLRDRTNGQVEFIVRSFYAHGLSGPDALYWFRDGNLDSFTVFGSAVGDAIGIATGIQNLRGIYSSREQEFAGNQAIIKDIEELVAAVTGGVIMNHSWHSGHDLFIFCRERVDTPDGFAGKEIGSDGSPGVYAWIRGMGATTQYFQRRYLLSHTGEGNTDCGLVDAGVNYYPSDWGRFLPRTVEYMTGPLPNFSFHNNVISREVWDGIPADLQQIILEEAAKSELEALRLAAAHNEVGLIKTLDAAMSMEFIPFSEEMRRRSLEAAMTSVIPEWLRQVGSADAPFITETFNNKLGPIVGLRINPDGTVVRTE